MIRRTAGSRMRMDSSNRSVKSSPPRHSGPAQGPQLLSAATQSMAHRLDDDSQLVALSRDARQMSC